MTRDELKKMYEECKLRELCKQLDCSMPTLYRRLDELGIARKGQGKGARGRRKLIID